MHIWDHLNESLKCPTITASRVDAVGTVRLTAHSGGVEVRLDLDSLGPRETVSYADARRFGAWLTSVAADRATAAATAAWRRLAQASLYADPGTQIREATEARAELKRLGIDANALPAEDDHAR